MASTTITLTFGSTTITIDTPDYPEDLRRHLDQWRSQAIGGRIWSVTRSTDVRREPIFHWNRLPELQFDNLFSFITSTVEGSTNDFDLTDWDGTTWTATYLGGLENAKMVEYDGYAVDLTLKLTS